MLIFSDGNSRRVVCGDYVWDVGEEDFTCDIRILTTNKVKAVWEVVKQYEWQNSHQGPYTGTRHLSTSNPDEPYSCDITITCEYRGITYTFERFNWETWDSDTHKGTIKMTGRYRGPYKDKCWACKTKIRAGDIICSLDNCRTKYRKGYSPYDKR